LNAYQPTTHWHRQKFWLGGIGKKLWHNFGDGGDVTEMTL